MLLMWHENLRDLLPLAAKDLLNNQKSKLDLDWVAVSQAFPQLSKDGYVYN
jgi:hypothetical protein